MVSGRIGHLKDPINESGLADVAILNDRYERYREVVDALTPDS
jgi:hypothetical protein